MRAEVVRELIAERVRMGEPTWVITKVLKVHRNLVNCVKKMLANKGTVKKTYGGGHPCANSTHNSKDAGGWNEWVLDLHFLASFSSRTEPPRLFNLVVFAGEGLQQNPPQHGGFKEVRDSCLGQHVSRVYKCNLSVIRQTCGGCSGGWRRIHWIDLYKLILK